MNSQLHFKLEPKKVRLFLLLSAAVLWILIWSVYGSSVYFLKGSVESGIRERLKSDTVILEDHLSRTLDAAASRLGSLAAFSTNARINNLGLLSQDLSELIRDDRVVRSVSLVDSRGRILASSTRENIGFVIAPGEIPSARSTDSSRVFFGKVYAFRDLADIASDAPTNSDLSFWLASVPFEITGRTYHWMATVNLGVFANLWQRLDDDPATEIAVYGYTGERIASHHSHVTGKTALGGELLSRVSASDMGFFEAGENNKFLIFYRASATHPAIMTVTGDKEMLLEGFYADRQRLGLYAGLATLLVLGLIFGAWRGYLRYEQSVVEMQNQSIAIDSHILLSESSPDGKIVSANPLFLKTTGYEISEIIGKNHRMFNSGLHPRRYYNDMWKTIVAGNLWRGTFRNQKKNGELFWVRTTIIPFKDAWGKVSRFVALYTDITDAMQAMEQVDYERRLRQRLSQDNIKLLNDANTDPLTRLPNRRGFDVFVDNLWRAAFEDAKANTMIAVMMLDLDHFKQVNDNHGHQAGDQVLIEVTSRWSKQVRASDLIARLGGEEFCVVLPQATLDQAQRIAEKIRTATCAEPIVIHGEQGLIAELSISVSVGLVVGGLANEGSVSSMQARADELLYSAKSQGRNRVASEFLEAKPVL